MESFLANIGCPFASSIDWNSKSHIVGLVCWLEDQKLRELEVQEREQLRSEGPNWDNCFVEYLSRLGCPYTWLPYNLECVYWLIYQATSLEFEEKFQEQVVVNYEQNEDDIREQLQKLGDLFDMSLEDYPNTTEFVNQLSTKIKYCLPSSNHELNSETFPLGLQMSDSVVSQLTLVLKMLYLSDFRELQNDVNALIVLGQEFTANPKLNSSLGRVGR